jgi:flagellar hook protein FlgE
MAGGSFSAGLSGLNANQTALSVIGNNLANINTIGYKTSTVTFADLVSQTVGGSSLNPMQVGLGVMTGSISPVFSQGPIESSSEATNVAIQGSGFFVVEGDQGQAYTRAGNFSFDDAGVLVTPDGYRVQGYTATNPTTGEILTTNPPTDIVVPPGVLRPPVATTSFQTLSNLDADAPVNATFTSSVQLYDRLGAAHVVTITFTKTAASTWTYGMTVPGAEVVGTPAGQYAIPGATGTLVFANGVLSTVNGAAPADVTVTTPAWANGAAAGTLSWDLVDANNVGAMTSYASASTTSSTSQNGSAAGTVNNISITADGTITGTFGAGQTINIGRLALANFNNPKGLVKQGSNRFGESQAAGLPNIGAPGEGGRGTLIGSSLESSNVDMAKEFTLMILAQRGYQANSKSITVADELLQDTLNMKR